MENEIIIRLLSFASIFVLIALWELAKPRRTLTTSKAKRWFGNLGIVGLNSLSAQLLVPIMPVAMALMVEVLIC